PAFAVAGCLQMAVIAVVQSYPYDANFGGDGAYLWALARYFVDQGHAVHGYVSDIVRGRTLPFYRSVFDIGSCQSWSVRSALRLPGSTFATLRPPNLRARREAACDHVKPSASESLWVVRKLDELAPDAVVLYHDAVLF